MQTLEHHLCYASPSGLQAANLLLATAAPTPCFFQGRFAAPRRAADLLLALSQVVGSRFHTPAAMLARILRESDPVITCATDRVRWEGFSACASAYARVDLLPAALEGAMLSQGTTNVDFGPAMRTALVRLTEEATVTIGRHGLEVTDVLEKVVPLSLRWLRGFLEACFHQLSMRPVATLRGVEIRRFFQGLPRSSSRGEAYLGLSGGTLRLQFHPSPGAHKMAGWERLHTLQSLLTHAQLLRVFAGPSGASGWVMETPDSRFTLALSPDVWRGFSGEGQALWELSHPRQADPDRSVADALTWQGAVRADELAQRTGLTAQEAHDSLAHFAALGMVGYDLAEGCFFRRHLPYPGASVDSLHPRLREARALVEAGAVTFRGPEAWVESGGVAYRVHWTEDGPRCSCPWFSRHGQERGACKHQLAADMQRGRQP